MRGWRSKLLFVLIVYFAGFASAIYALVPGSEDLAEGRGREKSPKRFAASVLKSDDFARRFRAGMDKWLDFGRDAAGRAADAFKEYSSREKGS